MYKLLTFLATMVLFSACTNNASPKGYFDTSEYTVENISGTDMQYATKKFDGKIKEEGLLLNGNRSGLWVTYDNKEKFKTSTSYVQGKKNGIHCIYNNRNQINEEIHYLNDKKNGSHTVYEYGRIKLKKHYKDDMLDGAFIEYSKNEKVQKSTEYKNNKMDGKMLFYNEEGKLTMEYIYKNGEKVSGGIVK